ncbi:MAG: hypothetical protein F6K58_06130 [Symploca sp. SIO2E9]|nr:hypothetical protein [Symploca sp. SIO2E9]
MKQIKPFAIAVSTILTLVLTLAMLFIPTAEAWAIEIIPIGEGETIYIGTIDELDSSRSSCQNKNPKYLIFPKPPEAPGFIYSVCLELEGGLPSEAIKPFELISGNDNEACLALYTGGYFLGKVVYSGEVTCVNSSPGTLGAPFDKNNCQISGVTGQGTLYRSSSLVCEENGFS